MFHPRASGESRPPGQESEQSAPRLEGTGPRADSGVGLKEQDRLHLGDQRRKGQDRRRRP